MANQPRSRDSTPEYRKPDTIPAADGSRGELAALVPAPGALVVGASAQEWARLAVGRDGQVPVVRKGAVVWEDLAPTGPLAHVHILADITDAGELAAVDDAASDGNIYGRQNGAWAVIAGGGDVTGPGLSVVDNLVLFAGTGGATIKDSGVAIADVVLTSDSRLTDARTPVAHTQALASITGAGTMAAENAADYTDSATLTTLLSGKADTGHTHALSSVTDAGTAAALNVAAAGDAASGEVVVGSDSRLTDARAPTSHTHVPGDVSGISSFAETFLDDTTAVGVRTTIGAGDLVGPASATDTAVPVFDGVSGKLVKNSTVLIDASGNVATGGTVDGRDVSADGGTLDAHVGSSSNPHATTLAQVSGTSVTTFSDDTAMASDSSTVAPTVHAAKTYTDTGLSGKSPKMPGEPNGFEDRTDCVLSFVNGTRTLTLTGTYTFWCNGTEYEATNDSFVISDVEGSHFVYYDDDGVLQESSTFIPGLITQYTYVAYIYWDATNNVAVPFAFNEQHGTTMDSRTHMYLHLTRGTVYQSGIALTVTSDGSGASDSSAQLASSAGAIWDEDIQHTVLARVLTDTIPVIYRDGADNWRVDASTAFPVLVTTTRPDWNEFTGGVWQRTEVSNNDYVLAHIYAVPGVNEDVGQVVAVMGQAQYGTIAQARAGAQTEILSLETEGLPFEEFKVVATLIYECKSTNSNAVAARIVSTDSGDDFIDWRSSEIDASGGSSGVTDHGLLAGLPDDDHTQYHNDARGDARYYTQSEVTSFLSGKSDTGHTHAQSDVTGLVSALAGKSDTGHTHVMTDVTDLAAELQKYSCPVTASYRATTALAIGTTYSVFLTANSTLHRLVIPAGYDFVVTFASMMSRSGTVAPGVDYVFTLSIGRFPTLGTSTGLTSTTLLTLTSSTASQYGQKAAAGTLASPLTTVLGDASTDVVGVVAQLKLVSGAAAGGNLHTGFISGYMVPK